MIGRFILRRVIIAFFQLLGVSLVVFFIIRLLPADPVAGLVGLNASEEAYIQAERSLGLDKSIFEQLSVFLGFSEDPGLVDASLGISWMTNEPVFLEIGRFLPVTLELVTLSLLLSFLIAIPLGMASATKPGSIADKAALIWACSPAPSRIIGGGCCSCSSFSMCSVSRRRRWEASTRCYRARASSPDS